MTTELKHKIRFLRGLALFFPSPAQIWSILPQKQKTERTISALPQTCAGHISTQLYKKFLYCMDKQWLTLETPEFSPVRDSSPHCTDCSCTHIQISTGMLLQENTCPVTKAKQSLLLRSLSALVLFPPDLKSTLLHRYMDRLHGLNLIDLNIKNSLFLA